MPLPISGGDPLAETADWLAERISLEIKGKCYVVGYSMGASIALLLARRHPELVSKLGLVSCSPRWGGGARGAAGAFPGLLSSVLRSKMRLEAVLAGWDAEKKKLMEEMLRKADRKTVRALLKALIRADLRGELSGVPQQALLIRGGNDPLVTEEMFRALHDGLKNSRAVTVPGADHLLCVTHADWLTETLITFGKGIYADQ